MDTGSPKPALDVLVADCDPHEAADLADLVTLLGHKPRVALTARHVLRLAAAPFPDAVLMDVKFPGVDGYDLAECLRAFLPQSTLPAVATGRAGYKGWSRILGIDHHFTKPIQVADLDDLLRRHARTISRSGGK